jgi:hypothetical protein
MKRCHAGAEARFPGIVCVKASQTSALSIAYSGTIM